MYFLYYSYHRNPMGREIFVRTRTTLAVKLLRAQCVVPDISPIWSKTFEFDDLAIALYLVKVDQSEECQGDVSCFDQVGLGKAPILN